MMDVDQEREALRKLGHYSTLILGGAGGKIEANSYGREAYLLGLYFSAISQVQGILCLADSKQYRVSANLIRNLYEIWVNARFIYCARTFVYARVMVLNSERERLKKLEILKQDGHVTRADCDKHAKRVRSMERFLARAYPQWPDVIPHVIAGGSPADRTKISLKHRCQIIDFYNYKYHRVNKKYTTMVKHYYLMYPHLSGGAHADPLALSQAFRETGDVINVDIDGSSDSDAMARLCSVAFAFHYDLIRTVKRYIFKEHTPKLDDSIEQIARDKGLIK